MNLTMLIWAQAGDGQTDKFAGSNPTTAEQFPH